MKYIDKIKTFNTKEMAIFLKNIAKHGKVSENINDMCIVADFLEWLNQECPKNINLKV